VVLGDYWAGARVALAISGSYLASAFVSVRSTAFASPLRHA
jgi:hypothetical protein